ncbi:MAG: hypothetical protein ACE5F1_10540, partial [Planctomycetota bacterium]
MPSLAYPIAILLPLTGNAHPRVAGAGDPKPLVRILARLEPGAQVALEACLAELTKTRPELSELRLRIRNLGPRGNARLPQASAFDIALAFPVLELELGARRHKLLALDAADTFYRVLWIIPYGPLGAGSPDWETILDGRYRELLLPDPIVEAEFEEALAALLARHGRRRLIQLRDFGTLVSLLDSSGIRQRLAHAPAVIGIVALTREECPRAAPALPAARLGIAISSGMRKPELGKQLLALLSEREWWRPAVGLPAGRALPGLAFEFATLAQRMEAGRLWRATLEPPREQDEKWPWLDSALLFGFSGVFLLLL